MCTIGTSHNDNGTVYSFKNRDLINIKENPQPFIVKGKKHSYIKFGVDITNKYKGVWAGINDRGVSILGADGNSLIDYTGTQYGGGEKTWEAYETVLSEFDSARKAYAFLIDFYQENKIGGTGDIIIIADKKDSIILEYSFNTWSIQFKDNPYMLRTNFFVNLPHLRPSPESNTLHMSSAKRYERALGVLSASSSNTTIDDIKRLLTDTYYGENAFSLCRSGGDGEYKTICSVVFEVTDTEAIAYYVMNDKPSFDKYKILSLPLTTSP